MVSIPSNISEGYGRSSTTDLVRFLYIAKGSTNELETQLEISFRLKYLNEEVFEGLKSEIIIVSKMLNSLIKVLKNKNKKV